jgi:hypothetical protein
MEMSTVRYFFGILLDAIRLAASDYEDQVQALPDFVFKPDEVALLFDDAYVGFHQVIAAKMVTDPQIEAVKAIDTFFDEMSSNKDKEKIWTLEAMETSPVWQELRLLARNALRSFNLALDKPDLSWGTYVPGGKSTNDEGDP